MARERMQVRGLTSIVDEWQEEALDMEWGGSFLEIMLTFESQGDHLVYRLFFYFFG